MKLLVYEKLKINLILLLLIMFDSIQLLYEQKVLKVLFKSWKFINFIGFFTLNAILQIILYLIKVNWCLDNLCLYGALNIVWRFFFKGFIKKDDLLNKLFLLYLIKSKNKKKFLQTIFLVLFSFLLFKIVALLKFFKLPGLKLVVKLYK